MYKYTFQSFKPYSDGSTPKVCLTICGCWDDIMLAQKTIVIDLEKLQAILGNPPSLAMLKKLIVGNISKSPDIGLAVLKQIKKRNDAIEKAEIDAKDYCDIVNQQLGDEGFGMDIEVRINEVDGRLLAETSIMAIKPQPEILQPVEIGGVYNDTIS